MKKNPWEKKEDPSMPGMFFYVNKDTGEMQREVQRTPPRLLRHDR